MLLGGEEETLHKAIQWHANMLALFHSELTSQHTAPEACHRPKVALALTISILNPIGVMSPNYIITRRMQHIVGRA